jgi:hypothetical protein
LLFRDTYNQINGEGAFQAMLLSIPEPVGIWLVSLAGLTLLSQRRYQNTR